jgi:diguanylate cyclase (GGDEF)-like protein
VTGRALKTGPKPAPAKPAQARLTDATNSVLRARVDRLCAEGRALRYWDGPRQKALAEEAFELACQSDADGDPYVLGMASALSVGAMHSISTGAWQAALAQTSQALALLVDVPATPVTRDLYESAGWAHFYTGDYVEAFAQLKRSLAIARALGDRSGEAYSLERLAAIQGATDHPDVALKSHELALELHRSLGDAAGEGLALNNMAYTYVDLGDLSRALESAQAALAFAEKAQWPYLLMGALDTLAYVHLRLGNLDEVERYARRDLELAHKHESPSDVINAMVAIGSLEAARSDWDAAADSVKRALSLADELGQIVEEYRCHKLLSQIEEGRGDYAAALLEYKAYHDLRQVRVSGDAESRLANLRIEHEVDTARKDAEIARLRSIALEREVEERRIAHAMLEAQASLDPLTRLYNRRHLELLGESLARALSENRPASLIMFDVDHFKDVNDVYGHLAGDSVLVAVAGLLVANSRDTDTPCRYGGDEFLVLLLDMDLPAAEKAADRLHDAISNACVRWDDHDVCVTISVGVATADPAHAEALDDLIERADRALYEAKHHGRDRVVVGRTKRKAG